MASASGCGAPPARAGGGPEILADPASLRRLELMALAWTAVGAAAFAAAGRLPEAAVLTGASAASIVAFLGLQRIVSSLRPEAQDDPEHHRPFDWRHGLAAVVRLAVLGALVVAGAVVLGRRFFAALVLGFSTLPAAFMTEGLLQMAGALRGKDHDGSS